MSTTLPTGTGPAAGLQPADGPDDLTPAWLGRALGAEVDAARVTRIGSGQIGSCYRCELTGPVVEALGTASVLVKLPTDDAGTRGMLAGAYRSETSFYRDLAATVAVDVPRCLAATDVTDDGRFTLVLEDLAPAVQGDQLAGCTPAQARAAAVNLAGLHGPRWSDPTLFDTGWLTRHDEEAAQLLGELYPAAVEQFLANLADLLSPRAREVVREVAPAVAAWSLGRADERFALVHGDYRLDNLMFHPAPGAGTPPVRAVDWQTLSVALPARDLAYLVATSLEVEQRRECERDIVAAYQIALFGHGVADHDATQCWEDYRYALLQGVLVSVFGAAYGARTDRGDRMFAVMVERTVAAIDDLGTLSLL